MLLQLPHCSLAGFQSHIQGSLLLCHPIVLFCHTNSVIHHLHIRSLNYSKISHFLISQTLLPLPFKLVATITHNLLCKVHRVGMMWPSHLIIILRPSGGSSAQNHTCSIVCIVTTTNSTLIARAINDGFSTVVHTICWCPNGYLLPGAV